MEWLLITDGVISANQVYVPVARLCDGDVVSVCRHPSKLLTGAKSTGAKTTVKSFRLIPIDQGITHASFVTYPLNDVAHMVEGVANSSF